MCCVSSVRLSLQKCHHSSFPVQSVLESGNSMLKGFWREPNNLLRRTPSCRQEWRSSALGFREQRLAAEQVGPMGLCICRQKVWERKGWPIWAQGYATEWGGSARLISLLTAVSNCVQWYSRHSGYASNISCISVEVGAVATSELPFWQSCT